MTRSEYQELVEFFGPKLDALEERLTRVEVLREEDRHQLQALAEAVGFNREANAREFSAIRWEMADGFATVWSEFGTLRSEMGEGFQSLRTEIAEGFKAVRSEIAGAPRIGPPGGFPS